MSKPKFGNKKTISSAVTIKAASGMVWKHITAVKLNEFTEPWYFKLLAIPKPVAAKVTKKGEGGHRMAYFKHDKTFTQEITTWKENKQYAFTFEPSDNFKAGHIFNLKTGPFRMLAGAYDLKPEGKNVQLTLETTYAIASNKNWVLNGPVRGVLKLFQNYLLNGIKKNAEKDGG